LSSTTRDNNPVFPTSSCRISFPIRQLFLLVYQIRFSALLPELDRQNLRFVFWKSILTVQQYGEREGEITKDRGGDLLDRGLFGWCSGSIFRLGP